MGMSTIPNVVLAAIGDLDLPCAQSALMPVSRLSICAICCFLIALSGEYPPVEKSVDLCSGE